MDFSNHPHWSHVEKVCDTLTKAGFQAWLAGGCVRDTLLGVVPHDFDIATDAPPEKVEKLFPKAVSVGKSFGVIILPFEGFNVEVATFRKDGLYVDGRRPQEVTFSTPREDAERRDFTINALFYDLTQKRVVDYVHGERDLKSRLIRAVGVPKKRFEEDKLRLLRAVRFSAQLDFEIETSTFQAVKELAPQIGQVSMERIRDELVKLLKSNNPVKGLHFMELTGLLDQVLPELAKVSAGNSQAWAQSKALISRVKSFEARLWLLLWPVLGEAELILRRLKFSNAEIRAALEALGNLKVLPSASLAQKRRMLAQGTGALLNEICVATSWLQNQVNALNGVIPAERTWVTGQDALDLGARPGPAMGHLLDEVFDLQLEGQLRTRDEALDYLRVKIVKHK